MKKGVIVLDFDKILGLKNSSMRIILDEPVEMIFCKQEQGSKLTWIVVERRSPFIFFEK